MKVSCASAGISIQSITAAVKTQDQAMIVAGLANGTSLVVHVALSNRSDRIASLCFQISHQPTLSSPPMSSLLHTAAATHTMSTHNVCTHDSDVSSRMNIFGFHFLSTKLVSITKHLPFIRPHSHSYQVVALDIAVVQIT